MQRWVLFTTSTMLKPEEFMMYGDNIDAHDRLGSGTQDSNGDISALKLCPRSDIP